MKQLIRLLLVTLVLGLNGCAHRVIVSPSADIVGTWRLEEYWDRDEETQTKRYPFGENPLGYFVYDHAGNVLIQIAKNPRPPRLSEEAFGRLSTEELRPMLQEYVAYFGTYTVDAAHGVVVHHVIADLRREYGGTDQPRQFQLAGDVLLIGDSRTWLRRLVRVR